MAYHPQGDGLVERFNRSLLQLLCTYTDKEFDWEQYLPLALYTYRTAVHSSTGVSPHMLMFGREPQALLFDPSLAFDSGSYQHYLCANLQDFMESNLLKAADQQKFHYDKQSLAPSFTMNDKVWLSVPTAGKLQPRWEGGWKVTSVKSPVTIEIGNGGQSKVVHSNRLQHHFQAATNSSESMVTNSPVPVWTPPQVDHCIAETVSQSHRYPS